MNDTYGPTHIRAVASSRNRLNLGLQVFALRRQVRSSFPHRATARWGPRIVSAFNSLSRLPRHSPKSQLLRRSALVRRMSCGHRKHRSCFRTHEFPPPSVKRTRTGRTPAGPTHFRISHAPSFKKAAASPRIKISGRQERRPLRRITNNSREFGVGAARCAGPTRMAWFYFGGAGSSVNPTR